MNDLAEVCGFQLRLCRPYRAKTQGRVERFNSYLKGSFVLPLASSREASGLWLDVDVANRHVRRWLDEVAIVRIHGTTGVAPMSLLPAEQAIMLPAPALKGPPSRVAHPSRVSEVAGQYLGVRCISLGRGEKLAVLQVRQTRLPAACSRDAATAWRITVGLKPCQTGDHDETPQTSGSRRSERDARAPALRRTGQRLCAAR